jgi:FkbM family methyltransferase
MNEKIDEVFEKLKPELVSTDSRVGDIVVYKNDSIVSGSILVYGEYSHAEIVVMNRYLDKDSVYFDVGTNIGYHVRAVSELAKCTVIGFEPHPKHFAVAAYNIKNDNNIKLYNCAVGDVEGEVTISDFDESLHQNYGEARAVEGTEGVVAKLITIDSLQPEKCTVMKIDVEGLEPHVLKGANKTIDKFRPVIFYEAQEYDPWTQSYAILEKKNYKQYWVTCRVKPMHETYKKTDMNPFGNIGVKNILAVPSEKTQPDDLMSVIAGEEYSITLDRVMNTKVIF